MLEDLFSLIHERFQARASESLADFVKTVPVHPENLDAQARWVFLYKDTLIEFLSAPENVEALIAYSVEHVKEYVYSRNQYLDLSPESRQTLRVRYAAYYTRIRTLLQESNRVEVFTRQLEAETMMHLTILSFGLQREIEAYSKSSTEFQAYLQSVACFEYSPEQQLAMLGISGAIQPPVLDLGCGAQAALCRYLHERGVEVVGIDRMAPDLPFCRRIGWEEFVFGERVWGTIISHQAFSAHFHFHHNHSEPKAVQMATLLMNILNSLKIGGTFVYTPGLPFIETFITNTGRFELRTVDIANAPFAIKSIAYAGHIRRTG